MKSSYGNYVMQKALKVSNGDNKTKLTESIINNIDKLNDKKLIFKWKQIASEASGKILNYPCVENFGYYSQNVSPNTSFNSINSNRSNNSNNSTNNNRNYDANKMIFNNHTQNNINNMIFNNTVQNNINNINNNNFAINPMCNLNSNPNLNTNTAMNYYYIPKNFSRSYNNSPVNMRMDNMFPNFSNFNNQGIIKLTLQV